MNKDMREFLKELGNLMNKYGVDMDAREAGYDYATYADGVDFEMSAKYEDGVLVRDYEVVEARRYLEGNDLLMMAKRGDVN